MLNKYILILIKKFLYKICKQKWYNFIILSKKSTTLLYCLLPKGLSG